MRFCKLVESMVRVNCRVPIEIIIIDKLFSKHKTVNFSISLSENKSRVFL